MWQRDSPWQWPLSPQCPFPTALLWLLILALTHSPEPAVPGTQPSQAKLRGHRHRLYPERQMASWVGEGPETPTGFQRDLGPKHLNASSVVWNHMDPATAWERSLGWRGRGKREKDLASKMEKGMKTKLLLTNKELNKGQRSLEGLIKV